MKKLPIVLAAILMSLAFAQGDLPDLEGRVLTVGSDTTYPPFETVNDAGEIVGFDVDVMTAICERINCVAEFVTTAWDGIFPALAAGEFDVVASGVTITEERDQVVDFTDPYFEVNQAVTTRVGDEDLTLEDFTAQGSDLTLGAQVGTTNASTAEQLVGRDRLRTYDDFNAAILALLQGDVDGVMIDDVIADAFVQQYAGELVVNIRDVESGDKLGFAVQEGDALAADLSAGIQAIRDDGTLDALIEEWLTAGE